MIVKATLKLTFVWFVLLILATGCKKHGFTNSVTHEDITTGLRSATTTGSQQIKIATYNTHLYLTPSKFEDTKRLSAIKEYFRKPSNVVDIIFFQEIWTDAAKNKLIHQLKKVYPYSYHSNSVNLSMGDGLLVLSKIPIKESSFFEFKNSAGWDALAHKGFLKVRFHTPNGDFTAYATHTNADSDKSGTRKLQFEQIWKDIKKIGDEPSIIVGDLNVASDSEEYEEMMCTFCFYKDTYRELYPDVSLYPGYTFDNIHNQLANYFYPRTTKVYQERLDYVLRSGKGWKTLSAKVKTDIKYDSSTLGNDVDCSDHYMYQTTLELSGMGRVADPYITNTYKEAVERVEALKRSYGTGLTAKIIIHNNTDDAITFMDKTSWYSSAFFSVPPREIPAGKYGVTLAVHDTGAATGVFNQLSYSLRGQRLSFGTYVPWSWVYTNNVMVSFKEIKWSDLYKYSARPSMSKQQGGIKISGKTAAGDSPLIVFSVLRI